ncbi:DUF1634 domain-containing protein [Frankia sp. AgKG'84/4]|uniref:DUF1634 domain-containing protein n=1 Tax=Frankia sp. AgKG'84/4 TaxID=573490 RepID=UPI00200C4619|nr:DUF1634 domain-containing protein [Frankia sp. AgKG'84/4]MCL9795752.1 DUF1634 domain-containing protein [Frankia sp. AgKG'84/4]
MTITSAGEAPEVGARAVALVLRIGGVVGILLVIAGLATGIGQDGAAWVHGPGGGLLDGSAPVRLSDLASGLRHGRSSAVILLGMAVLVATPAAGVVAAGLAWLRSRQPWLAAVAAVVILLLVVAGGLGAES